MTLNPDADPANNMNVSSLIWEIRRVRRCELMCDLGYRYWDLVRWHQLDKLDSNKYPNINKGANIVNLADKGKQNVEDRKSTRLNSSHANISYAVFCLKIHKIVNVDGTTRITPI